MVPKISTLWNPKHLSLSQSPTLRSQIFASWYLWEQRPSTGLLATLLTMPLTHWRISSRIQMLSGPEDEMIETATEKRLLADYGVAAKLAKMGGRPWFNVYTHQNGLWLCWRPVDATALQRGTWREFEALAWSTTKKFKRKFGSDQLICNFAVVMCVLSNTYRLTNGTRGTDMTHKNLLIWIRELTDAAAILIALIDDQSGCKTFDDRCW